MSDFNPHEIDWNHNYAARLWDYYSTNASYSEQYFSMLYGKDILKYVAKIVPIKGTIIDYGCGPGFMLEKLLEFPDVKTIGVDFSEDTIGEANKKVSKNDRSLGNYYTSTLPFTISDNTADMLVMIEVIEHLDDELLIASLKETHRLLKKGSVIVVTTPNDEALEESKTMCPECGCIFHRWQHVRIWNEKSIKNIMMGAGFETIHIGCTTWQTSSGGLLKNWYRKAKKFLKRNKKQQHLIYIGRSI